ncbi:hypothetical protein CWI81_10365 [Idiomarina seosinensis]|uniref:Uncharacterized protein n=1 Tax=Idiomarina seosinensis TaxID=281739 RepID=A0A432ZBQ4_9GAMM|nr:hypothetical protein CWI81_10365 [Idiomarina seosinensis]
MRTQQSSRIRLEIDSQQLMRLMQDRQLVVSDFRCCDSKSRCVLKLLLLECSARTINQVTK